MIKVLIVDDDLQIQRAYADICRGQGWTVVIARDGIDAFGKLAKHQPDVILLDIIMPRLNGIDFLKRAHDKKIKLPPTIIMTNSLVGYDAKKQAKSLGVDSYNVKTHVRPHDIVKLVKDHYALAKR